MSEDGEAVRERLSRTGLGDSDEIPIGSVGVEFAFGRRFDDERGDVGDWGGGGDNGSGGVDDSAPFLFLRFFLDLGEEGSDVGLGANFDA